MPKNVEDWIVETEGTGLLDWGRLRAVVGRDVADQVGGGVCSVCLHSTHPGRPCPRRVPDEERPLDSDVSCGCDCSSTVERRPSSIKTVTVVRKPGELSVEEMEQACRNIGFDLQCGQCAQVFYTGSNPVGNHPHDESCFTNKLLLKVLLALSPLDAVASAYDDRCISTPRSELDEHSVLVGGNLGVKLLTVGDALAARDAAREVSRVIFGGGVRVKGERR